MEVGLKVHVPVVQARLMAPWKVLGAAAVTVNVADFVPISTTLDLTLDASVNTALPVPVSDTPCGLLLASSSMVSDPVRLPLDAGVDVTLTVQVAPTLRTVGRVPQELVCAKSPLVVMLLMLMAVFPVLVSWTVCAGLVCPTVCAAKVREVCETDSVPADVTPPPVTVIACGFPAALSVMVIWSVTEPV